MTVSVDIAISGGGIAGLVAAAVLGQQGYSVCVIDPSPVATGADDLRSTAFLRPSQALMERAGLWAPLAEAASPLDALRLVDTVGWPPERRDERLFRASDIGEGPFGWNLPNALTRATAEALVGALPHVDYARGRRVARLLQRMTEALVWLDDGTKIRARLVIGADGRNSAVRQAAGITATTRRYGQKALAFSVLHTLPHGAISTEIYNQGGAFTLVPLPDLKGRHASSVVWMADGRKALDLAAMPPEAFIDEAQLRSIDTLGSLTLASPRQIWPVVTQTANQLTSERVALVAEAAHVLPPIGAQGLNTSLADISALVTAIDGMHDPGQPEVLERYAKARQADLRLRATAIDLFNRVAKSGQVPLQALRLAGLRAVHDLTPLRQTVMRAGMGG